VLTYGGTQEVDATFKTAVLEVLSHGALMRGALMRGALMRGALMRGALMRARKSE